MARSLPPQGTPRPGESLLKTPRPHQIDETQRQRIIKARYKRRIYRQISQESGIRGGTIARLVRREGLNRLAALEPAPPPRRYGREAPGDLLHLDIKELGRFDMPGHRATDVRQKGRSPDAG